MIKEHGSKNKFIKNHNKDIKEKLLMEHCFCLWFFLVVPCWEILTPDVDSEVSNAKSFL